MTRRGFMLILAIGLLSILSMVVLLLTTRISADVKRTSELTRDAQQRLLVLSAATEAAHQLRSASPREGNVARPAALGNATTLRFEDWDVKDAAASVRVVLSGPQRRLTQVAEFERRDGRWRLVVLRAE